LRRSSRHDDQSATTEGTEVTQRSRLLRCKAMACSQFVPVSTVVALFKIDFVTLFRSGQKPLRREHARRRGKSLLSRPVRGHPQVSESLPTCGDLWRFRSDFPTDARDPPLAIVRLRRCATKARRGGCDVRTVLSQRSHAAQQMKVGPSDSDCRVRVQTTGIGVGPMTGVVSVSGKGGTPSEVDSCSAV
jgi:hypothetical protein